jgi:hypothetical protein
MSIDIHAIYWQAPKVTAERQAAWDQWIQSYAISTAQSWIEGGAGRKEATAGAAAIVAELRSLDSEEWMPLGAALLERMSAQMASDEPLVGEPRRRFLNALRTAETSMESDRTAVVAYQLGLSVLQAEAMVRKVQRAEKRAAQGKTSLYRHYDASGVLLYVGIAKDPLLRSEQHEAQSNWYRFVDRTDIEWFDTRDLASAAERSAITTERPIFNDTHNRANRTAAIDYLLAALDKVGAVA